MMTMCRQWLISGNSYIKLSNEIIMKKKTILGHESNYIDWLFSERYQISITVGSAILPALISLLVPFLQHHKGCACAPLSNSVVCSFNKDFPFNSLFQTIFIFISLYILLYNYLRTKKMLENNRNLIANYIERNTNKRMKRCNEKFFLFTVVANITRQFYMMWIVVWMLWLVYYFGDFTMQLLGIKDDENPLLMFHLIMDFLSSMAMFAIYLILSNVTTKRKERASDNNGLLYGLLFMVVLFTIWLALIISIGNESIYYSASISYQYCLLLESAFSVMSFVLVLGKLNSNYLQLPGLFLLVMYLYAIIQAYIPLEECKSGGYVIRSIIPYVTFIGKIFVMLTLCWIVDKKRLIFFIIQKSAALDETPALLDELDSEPVEY